MREKWLFHLHACITGKNFYSARKIPWRVWYRNSKQRLVMWRKSRKMMSRAKSRCIVYEVMESIIFSFRLQGITMKCDESKCKVGQGGICWQTPPVLCRGFEGKTSLKKKKMGKILVFKKFPCFQENFKALSLKLFRVLSLRVASDVSQILSLWILFQGVIEKAHLLWIGNNSTPITLAYYVVACS